MAHTSPGDSSRDGGPLALADTVQVPEPALGSDDAGGERGQDEVATQDTPDTLDGAGSPSSDSMGGLLAALAATPDMAPTTRLRAGDVINGTFRIERRIGAGGMGVVYLARDLRLGRPVAVKVHTALARGDGAAQLRREANAMARLTHPNVITVHEVGTVDGHVFIAMEFVDGWTCRSWLAEKPRSWREIARVFAAAGRGLAAAHDARLVHRDFKPDNILIGKDGRVRVADFGLARTVRESSTAVPVSASLGDIKLTHTGAVIGTPAYMAPEQWEGSRLDARTDQFSFCVALYEALVGVRPFAGTSSAELLENIRARRMVEPTGRRRARQASAGEGARVERQVPAHLRHALRRGLDPDPARRFPSMHALVAVLERDPAQSRMRWALAAISTAAVITGAAGLYAARNSEPACPSAEDELAGIWDDARRAAVEEAFRATEAPYAADTFTRTRTALDTYASGWLSARQSACEATRVRGAQSEAMLDRRVACLGERLGELDALVRVLAQADATVVRNAVQAAQRLPDLQPCADTTYLLGQVKPPPHQETARAVEALELELASARARRLAGKPREGLPIAENAVRQTEALRYAPAQANALLELASLEYDAGVYDRAESTFTRAYFTARGAGHDPVALRAAIGIVDVLGIRAMRFDEAASWSRHAQAEVERAGTASAEHARLLGVLGTIAQIAGDHTQALEHHQRSLMMLHFLRGSARRDVAETLHRIGQTYKAAGQYSEAVTYHRKALAMYEELLGPDHPDVANALDQLGINLTYLGRPEEAVPLLERAVAVSEEAVGREHVDTGYHLLNLGVTMNYMNENRRALELYDQALAVIEGALGADHPDVALVLNSMAVSYERLAAEQGRAADYERALGHYQRALEIAVKSYGMQHSLVATAHGNLAQVLSKLERHAEALESYRQSIAIWEQINPAHPSFAFVLTAMAGSLSTLGRHAEAVPLAERALAIYGRGDASPRQLGRTRLRLAQALVALGRDRARCRALLVEAREELRALGSDAGDGVGKELATIEALLAKLDRGTQ